MLQITHHDEEARQTVWDMNLEDFENPETLATYLRFAARPGSFRIAADGMTIAATPEAIDAATAELMRDIAADYQ